MPETHPSWGKNCRRQSESGGIVALPRSELLEKKRKQIVSLPRYLLIYITFIYLNPELLLINFKHEPTAREDVAEGRCILQGPTGTELFNYFQRSFGMLALLNIENDSSVNRQDDGQVINTTSFTIFFSLEVIKLIN